MKIQMLLSPLRDTINIRHMLTEGYYIDTRLLTIFEFFNQLKILFIYDYYNKID